MEADQARATCAVLTDHIVDTLGGSHTNNNMDKAERLVKDLGEVDTSTCDVDALMVHPRVQAALREHVFTCISIFFSLSER